MNIEVFRGNLFRKNQPLLGAIEEIICPYYENTTTLLNREINHCDTVYVNRDDDGKINAFAMFALEDLYVAGEGHVPTAYAGLSATSVHERGRGLIFRLWSKAGDDGMAWEERSGRRLLTWATTATPTSYFGAAFFHDLEPCWDGSYTAASLPYVDAIRRKLDLPEIEPSSHPYVLRGIAKNTRYSQIEMNKIARFSVSRKFDLLNKLEIDERKGDRLLMIGRFKSTFGRGVKESKSPLNRIDSMVAG